MSCEYDGAPDALRYRDSTLESGIPDPFTPSHDTGVFRTLNRSSELAFVTTSQDAGHHIGVWKNIVFVDFAERIEGHMLRAVGSTVQQVLLRHPDGLGLVFIAEEGCRPPPISLREEMLAMRQKTCDRTLAIGYVIRFDGFVASALRGAITGTQIVTRSQFPEKVFKHPDMAASWLAPRCGCDSPFERKRLRRMMQHVLPSDTEG